MTFKLYNTLNRKKEDFEPANPPKVTVYVCGPTVYNLPHIGNARPAVVFDVLVRLLRTQYEVVYARNITDIDDKISTRAQETGLSIREIAEENAAAYHADVDALGVLHPDIEPFATDHIPQMITMISTLIEQGHAYVAEGHVLFRVSSYADYGHLSRRDTRQLIDGARVDVAPYKEDAGDFVLWKPSSDDLPGWDSPWCRGRPGWHIECSAMAAEHLGPTIDIHGGGNDLIFPHHENEIAQSTCAHNGKLFSRYWMHNGFVNVDQTKMSKSLGNVVLVRDLLKDAPGEAVRLALLSGHYRQPLDWSDDLLAESCRKLDRLYTALRNTSGWQASWQETGPSPEFIDALSDDLNTPKAFAELFNLARQLNKSTDVAEQARLGGQLRASAEIIGLLGQDPEAWFAIDHDAEFAAKVEALLEQRISARTNKDYARADQIRDELSAMGVVIEDGPDGTRWQINRD
jgi:cysteinyl-tRNA synthetase